MDEENKLVTEEPEIPVPEPVPSGVDQTQDIPEPKEEETDEPGDEPKKGFQGRVKELNTRAKEAEKRAQTLEQKLAELTAPSYGQDDYSANADPILAEGEEIDAQEFQRRVLEQAGAMTELRIKQSEAVTRINNEASEILREYPELDPGSDKFNEQLSDSITQATETYIRAEPYSASLKKFVGNLMKPYRDSIEKEVSQERENIARQVSTSAIRPSSFRHTEKHYSQMTADELEEKLGVVQS